MKDEVTTLFEDGLSRHLKKSQIEDRDNILMLLNTSFPWTSRMDIFFANNIMFESLTLIKNSVIQFEEGFFDAAMYSLRQSIENMNNTLFLVEDKEKLKSWMKKEKFPSNKSIIEQLEKHVKDYKDIKSSLSSWFDEYEKCNKTANKYIHKQGFDTFYEDYKDNEEIFKNVNDFYNKYLRNTITHLFVMYIAINPMCLVLSDPELLPHIHMNLLDDPLPIDFVISVMGEDEFNKIKTTNMYLSLKEYFEQFEALNYNTELLMKYQIIDYNCLDEINAQKHLLGPMDKIVLDVANAGVAVSYIFFSELTISPYTTSIEPTQRIYEYSSHMFDDLFNEQNILWNGMYCNKLMRDANNFVVLVSNNVLSNEEIIKVGEIIKANNY